MSLGESWAATENSNPPEVWGSKSRFLTFSGTRLANSTQLPIKSLFLFSPPGRKPPREHSTASGKNSPILVHFGDSDFANRYHLLDQNIGPWRVSAGRVDSVDLRFARQVVVNPESKTVAADLVPGAPQRAPASRKRQ
jgi:hypothetical protein